MTDFSKKHKEQRSFSWPENGHRMNLYLNVYLNVAVREDKFQDYIAAALETLASELRREAAKARGKWLQSQVEMLEKIDVPVASEEQKEVAKEEKAAERERV